MKKTVFLSLLVLMLPLLSHAETVSLKLRASKNPGSIRIVFEGPESVINKGAVTRKENDLLVVFAGVDISIKAESTAVIYSMLNRETVVISPGEFSGMKVFTLKEPARLVIDVYLKEEKGDAHPFLSQKTDKVTNTSVTGKVIIDPGHGGYQDGITRDSNKEKNSVLDIAQKLGAMINSVASRSVLTRGSDRYMSIGERVNFANSRAADIFISLHIGNHREIVIFTPVITDAPPDLVKPYLLNRGQADYEKKTLTLLKALSEAIIPVFGEDMISARPIPYTMISRIEAAALIIELPSYEYASYSDEYNNQIAETIYKGLEIYEEGRVGE
ncbi:MAG: N-acetylmuramoyl-L-alanine amidase [Nitrospirota bacterium]